MMLDPFTFDPRSTSCKDPFGAVPCGSAVTFTLRPPAREGFCRCTLLCRLEFSGKDLAVDLAPGDASEDRSVFSGVFPAPAEPELIWYCFQLFRQDGASLFLSPTGCCSADPPERWQLTVYEDRPAPDWFGGAVAYQIFPDRFCRLTVPDPTGLVGERTIHRGWDEEPCWQPDEHGEVRNSDFFGGSLAGITRRLSHLADLGVTVLYLNPIFEAASNHRYDTADYLRIDPLLGTEADFRTLCRRARELGIRVILDGVFNHTGSRSRYFNQDGFYPDPGAAQSQDSPYYEWYSFHPWPEDYDAWWGIRTLPAVREDVPSYRNFIISGPDSVVRRCLRLGASGWRLDVADELPDDFIAAIRAAMEETDPESFLLGEVWEDATTKIAYSRRRRYLLGRELHSVMNYPFRTALIAYLRGDDADHFRETMETIREHYPPEAFHALMNFLGTHDTPRILTVLGGDTPPAEKAQRAADRLSPRQRQTGKERLALAALTLFTFPGTPTIYYGDEAGLEGWEDPFNRRTYPWGQEDPELMALFARLGRLRRDTPALQRGALHWRYTAGPFLVYARELEGTLLTTVLHAGDSPTSLSLHWPYGTARDVLTGRTFTPEQETLTLDLSPRQGLLLEQG